MVVVEGAQAEQVRAVTLEHNAHALGHALQGDFLFEPFDLCIGYSRHIASWSGVPQNPVNPFFGKITRLHNTSFRCIVNFVMKNQGYPMRHVPLPETVTMAISPDERAFFVELGARVAELRKTQGITQIQMADALGVSQQTVNSYEVGRRRIPVSALPLLARLLAMSIDELLLGGEGKTAGSKRGPTPKLQQQMERVSLLPRAKQKFVIEMIDTVIQQAS